MSDPTPIQLPDGEALYRAGDLPDEGWEARHLVVNVWTSVDNFGPESIVVARRKRWVPQPGDRVRNPGGEDRDLAVAAGRAHGEVA